MMRWWCLICNNYWRPIKYGRSNQKKPTPLVASSVVLCCIFALKIHPVSFCKVACKHRAFWMRPLKAPRKTTDMLFSQTCKPHTERLLPLPPNTAQCNAAALRKQKDKLSLSRSWHLALASFVVNTAPVLARWWPGWAWHYTTVAPQTQIFP